MSDQAPSPTKINTLEIRAQCEALVIGFAHHIDHREFEEAIAVFTENAVFERPDATFNGHADMREFWSQRPPEHVTRHLCCPPFFTEVGENSAKTITQVTLYNAQKSESPVPTISSPTAVIEFHDSFELTAQGWRIAHRRGVPIMIFG